MQGSFQNKLLQYEEKPPASAWENISRQLDEEFASSDINISSKLDNASIPPPPSAWTNIETAINESPAPAKLIPLLIKRISVAAILIGAMVAGTFYFFSSNPAAPVNTSEKASVKQNTPEHKNVVIQPVTSEQKAAPPVPKQKVLIASNTRHNTAEYFEGPQNRTYAFNETEAPYLTPPDLANDASPVSVDGPPIRDANGNVIMDLDLISKPGQQYITVTSPNGNQTKLSNKFLKCLSDNCNGQFEEWKEKLLTEPAFIPTANNFFDIFELKDIIQD